MFLLAFGCLAYHYIQHLENTLLVAAFLTVILLLLNTLLYIDSLHVALRLIQLLLQECLKFAYNISHDVFLGRFYIVLVLLLTPRMKMAW